MIKFWERSGSCTNAYRILNKSYFHCISMVTQNLDKIKIWEYTAVLAEFCAPGGLSTLFWSESQSFFQSHFVFTCSFSKDTCKVHTISGLLAYNFVNKSVCSNFCDHGVYFSLCPLLISAVENDVLWYMC